MEDDEENERRPETKYRMTRLVRTRSSEIYLVWDEDRRLGQLDLHYADDTIHGTLVLEGDISLEDEEGLISQIDDDIVHSYLPPYEREDFLVTVFRGEEISQYNDTSNGMEDDMEDMEDDMDGDDHEDEHGPDEDNGNGRRRR